MSSQARGYLFVSLAATLWGIAGATAKYLFTSTSIDAFLLVQVRMGFSALLLLAALAVIAPASLKIRRQDITFLVIFGVAGMAAVQYTYLFTISKTNVATAIFLQYLAPVMTALWAWIAERQNLGRVAVGCLGLAITGSVLLIFGGTAHLLVSPLGLTTGLLSAAFLAFYTIYGARGVDRFSPWALLGYGLGIGFLFWLVVDVGLALAGHPLQTGGVFRSGAMWAYFGYLATLATIIPFGLYLVGLRFVEPTKATITAMLEPVVGALVSFLLIGESLGAVQIAGGGCIVAAVIVLQYGQARAKRNQKTPAA